ncbi:MAG: Bax inhibitor-1/YccA family protein [Candidatus Binatia bacterium]
MATNKHLALRSGNPALSAETFRSPSFSGVGAAGAMTVQGTVNKTALSLLLLMITAAWTWNLAAPAPMSTEYNVAATAPWTMVGVVGGFIVAMVTIFKKEWSPVTAPAYALLEGLALGGISVAFESRYPGIASQAVFLTFGTLGALLMAYRSGLIQATENMKLGIVAATGGIALIYLASFVMSFFGASIPLIHSSGTFGILFSMAVVTVAALNLVLDFDFIEQGAESGAPKYMEWYASFGLMVTLVWLYLEILRLLAKLQERR